jgi:hypothetical protein
LISEVPFAGREGRRMFRTEAPKALFFFRLTTSPSPGGRREVGERAGE